MKYCAKCKCDVNTSASLCPLCQNELDGKQDSQELKYFLPRFANDKKENPHYTLKIFLMLSLFVIVTTVFANLSIDRSTLWCLVVLSSIVYAWILVCHTIMSRRGFFEKFFLNALGMVGVLYSVQYLSSNVDWFLSYVFPSMGIVAIIVLSVVTWSVFHKLHKVLSFFLITIIFAVTYAVIYFVVVPSFSLLTGIASIYSLFTAVAIVILAGKQIRQEASKKYHL